MSGRQSAPGALPPSGGEDPGAERRRRVRRNERGAAAVGNIERFAFYEEAKTAYAIIATSEKALYANVMLQKGVVVE